LTLNHGLDEVFLQECIYYARSGKYVTIQTRVPKRTIYRALDRLGATEEELENIEVVRL